VAVRQANSADKAGGRVTGPAARHSESVTLRGTHKAEDRSSFRRHTGWRRFSSALRTCFGVKTVPMTIMSKPAADLVIDSDLVRALSRARFRIWRICRSSRLGEYGDSGCICPPTADDSATLSIFRPLDHFRPFSASCPAALFSAARALASVFVTE